MFERILVPLDGSKLAEQALPPVAELASAFGSKVTLLQVCEPDKAHYENVCRVYLAETARRLKQLLRVPGEGHVDQSVLVGRPAELIISFAKNNAVDIIVMTCCGKSGVISGKMGITCHRVLQRAEATTLVVRATQEGISPSEKLFRRIVVPLDMSERGEAVLQDLTSIAEKLASEVVLVHVVASGQHVHTIGGLNYVPFKDQDVAAETHKGQDYLEKVKSEMLASVRATIDVRVGDPADEILNCAVERDASLIAMSSHGHSGLELWAFGSVTHRVIEDADRSVLLHRYRVNGR
ncbi:MAG: universal stress protein [Chloroflexi bacterium]|nr:universal stress protein [Chloroflexota bacterium]